MHTTCFARPPISLQSIEIPRSMMIMNKQSGVTKVGLSCILGTAVSLPENGLKFARALSLSLPLSLSYRHTNSSRPAPHIHATRDAENIKGHVQRLSPETYYSTVTKYCVGSEKIPPDELVTQSLAQAGG